MKLLIDAFIKYIAGLFMVGILLFLPAGTFQYTYAWLFIGLLFIPMFILGTILFLKAPALLEKRLNTKEQETTQKWVVAWSGLFFVSGFIVAGLDWRFGWSDVPVPVIIAASVVLLASYALYAEVMRENAYLSRTVEVQNDQKVIDTGLYGVVRHPMYLATLWLFGSIPIVLGSWWSFLCFLPYLGIIIVRICNEEKVLEANLEGYSNYKKKVKYRLLPLIW